MLEAIALLIPPLMAVGVHNHLHREQLKLRHLAFIYAVFVVLINIVLFVITLYLFKHSEVVFTSSYFVKYLAAGSVLAIVLPFVLNLIEASVSVTVKKNDQ